MKTNSYVAAFFCSALVLGQMFWKVFDMPILYFLPHTLGWAAILFAYSRLLRVQSEYLFILFDFFFILALGDVIDEVCFKPESFEIMEYVTMLTSCVFVVFRVLAYETKLPIKILLKRIFLWKLLKKNSTT